MQVFPSLVSKSTKDVEAGELVWVRHSGVPIAGIIVTPPGSGSSRAVVLFSRIVGDDSPPFVVGLDDVEDTVLSYGKGFETELLCSNGTADPGAHRFGAVANSIIVVGSGLILRTRWAQSKESRLFVNLSTFEAASTFDAKGASVSAVSSWAVRPPARPNGSKAEPLFTFPHLAMPR